MYDKNIDKPKRPSRVEYILTWSNPNKKCDISWSNSGSWTYYEKKKALQDKSFYSMYYDNVNGPFPVSKKKSNVYNI